MKYGVRVQGPKAGPGSSRVFGTQIRILPHSGDSFPLILDIYFNTKKWIIPSSWISENFLCIYKVCIFKVLILQKMMSFWKSNISAQNIHDQILYDC